MSFLKPITLQELKASETIREHWPEVWSLIQRYLYTKSVKSAKGATCDADKAQAEAAVNKLFAELMEDLGALAEAAPGKPDRPKMKQLNRFTDSPKPDDK